jgi:hypothetical protein
MWNQQAALLESLEKGIKTAGTLSGFMQSRFLSHGWHPRVQALTHALNCNQ